MNAITCFTGPTYDQITVTQWIGGPSGPLRLRADPFWDMDAATMRWTTRFVNEQVCSAIQSLLTTYPSVWSWNGRVGDICMNLGDVEWALYSLQTVQPTPIYPKSPTPPVGTNDDTIATTAWVNNAIGDIVTDEINSQGLASKSWVQANTVNSFNGRQGVVTLTAADVYNVGAAPLNNPNFSGIPQAPTALPGTTTSQIATTAFVQAAISASVSGVASFNTRTGDVILASTDITEAGGALINSPTFTGIPTANTATAGTNTNQLATTAFVQNAIGSVTGVTSFNLRSGAVTLTATDLTNAGGALLASPTFTGVPAAPTAPPNTNTTQLATTAFVQTAVGTAVANLPATVQEFNGRTGIVTLTTNDVTAVGGLVNPSVSLTGVPVAPTPAPGTNNTQIATTAFVQSAVATISAVTTFNGRSGAVTLVGTDITGAGGALLASPTFTGTPSAPTASPGTNTTQLATTAFVQAAVAASTAGVTSFNTRVGAVTLTTGDVTGVGGALLASPSFTGTPSGPTAAPGTNTTQLATTAFVMNAIATTGGVTSFNGRAGAVTLSLNDITAAGGAPIASPTFTGVPAAPTAAVGTDTTQIATTAFVTNALSGISGITVSATAPTNPQAGQGWYNLNDGQTYVWTGSTWAIAVNPPVPNLSNYAQLSGATFTGSVVLPANATTPMQAVPLQQVSGLVPQNYVDNSGFSVNQRSYVSGTALAAGTYGLDRWKAGASGATITFTLTPSNTPITITSGSLQQVIEGLAMITAPYVLSWQGTATGRISTTSGGGTYAASPITFNGTVSTNTYIEFTGGTLSQVQLQLGSVVTPWQPQPYEQEISRCQRFYQFGSFSFYISGTNGWGMGYMFQLPTMPRAIPTYTVSGLVLGNCNNFSMGVSGSSAGNANCNATATATGNAGFAGNFTASADL